MGLRFTRAADYAVRAMLHVGSLPEGSVALREDIALAQRIPTTFMAKILRKLVNAGLLRSSRGTNGGFGMARRATVISLLDIVEGIEGPLGLTDCAPGAHRCSFSHNCPASTVWFEVQRGMSAHLRDTTLEALLSAPRRNRRANQLP